MDLKYLQTFATIVEEGGFSQAASKLNYTQSTITFQIGQLEQELNVKLFEKIGRRMVLTQAGELLVPYVQNVLRSVDKIQYFQNDLENCQGDLTIGVAETILCYKLPHILAKLQEQAPQARLFIKSMNCYDIRDALLDGTLDVGIFYQNVGGLGDKLSTYSLGSYANILVASPALTKNFLDFTKPAQKLDVPFIINEKNCIFRQIFENYLRERGITLDHTIELWSIPTIINLVKNNVGITYLPRFTIEEDLRNGNLVEIDCAANNTMINAVVAHHKNKWISPLMQLFLNLCRENFI